MDEERVLTKHPRGKKGVNISKTKYDVIKSTMIECLKDKELTHLELTKCVNEKLRGKFQGFVNWYFETVKLDLEARNIIERTTESKPQVYLLREG